jgi:glutaredoxin
MAYLKIELCVVENCNKCKEAINKINKLKGTHPIYLYIYTSQDPEYPILVAMAEKKGYTELPIIFVNGEFKGGYTRIIEM